MSQNTIVKTTTRCRPSSQYSSKGHAEADPGNIKGLPSRQSLKIPLRNHKAVIHSNPNMIDKGIALINVSNYYLVGVGLYLLQNLPEPSSLNHPLTLEGHSSPDSLRATALNRFSGIFRSECL
ncbi:hypothetical protein CEXT_671851 [Caerostris extrusa]|uniref:Uncharacterized protein n=1 Tax=Caerostris extrusa TaxID=172846 RepID=A0AAV4S2T0_CAEEX|nr:hypothetical protein CEXT_671851 [Caerostris extrusa]